MMKLLSLYLWWQFSSSSSSSVGVRLSRIQSLVSLRSETPSSCPVLPFPSPDLNRKQQQRYITQLRYHDRRLLFKRGNGRSYTLFLGNSSNTSPVMLGILHVVQSSWIKVQLVVSLHVVMNWRFQVLHTVSIIDSICVLSHPLLLVFCCRYVSFTRW